MPEHPLTDDFCHRIAESWPLDLWPLDSTEKDNMRAAADWQLEQVMKWLDEHLVNYSDDPEYWCCSSINDLEDHLKKAMRPTTTQENN